MIKNTLLTKAYFVLAFSGCLLVYGQPATESSDNWDQRIIEDLFIQSSNH